MTQDIVYELDNDVLLGKLIEDNWALKGITVKTYYQEDRDVLRGSLAQTNVLIKVVVGDVVAKPMGIGFDGESLSRRATFIVMSMKRENVVAGANELRRILAVHRFNPCGYWQQCSYVAESSRAVKNTFNVWAKGYVYKLSRPWHALPKRLIL